MPSNSMDKPSKAAAAAQPAAGNKRRRLLFKLMTSVVTAGLAAGVVALLAVTGVIPWDRYGRRLEQKVVDRAASRQHRLLVIGDSFLDQWPMEHCLRRDLFRYAAQHELGLKVLARGGNGPFEYRANMGLVTQQEYRPQLVVVFYHVGNDLTDTLRSASGIRPPPGAEGRRIPPAAPGPWATLPLLACNPEQQPRTRDPHAAGHPRKPSLKDYDWQGLQRHGTHPELMALAKESFHNPTRMDDRLVSATLLTSAMANSQMLLQNVLIKDPAARSGWQQVESQLSQLSQLARGKGAEVALVIIPSMVQISQAQLPFIKQARFKHDPALFTSVEPQRRLTAWCQRQKVTCVDLLPALKARKDRDTLYFLRDDHFNERGHRAAYEVVQRVLLDPWLKRQAGSQGT